jgi:flagellar biosynthesis activator protein FlaF
MSRRLSAVYAMQLEAYKTAQNTNMSGREIEAAALTRCALMLAHCQQNWDTPDRDEVLSGALRINQRVWSILQAELVQDDNPLPIEIRNNLLTLSVFIDKRIIEVMAYPEPEKLQIIIDININLAAGLRGSPAD